MEKPPIDDPLTSSLQTTNRRRLLFVNHTGALGGGELSLLDLAIAYRETSQVLLFDHGPFEQRLKDSGVTVTVMQAPEATLSARSSGSFAALKALPGLWQMAQWIKQVGQGFEVVHTNSQKAFVAGAIARFLGSPPIVWHLRDILTADHFSSFNRFLAVTLANSQASRVLVNSNATGAAFVAAGGNKKRVNVLFNGISSAPFDAVSPSTRENLRLKLGIPHGITLIGVFSRLSYWKGQHILLEAIRHQSNVHALLVGDVLFGENEYYENLKVLANAPELNGRVHWLGFRDDIPDLMKACDIIAHTSTSPEPFGRVIIEGQLSQRPVIATADGGAVELIQEGQTGCLVVPGDSNTLAKKIQDLVAHPEATDDMAKRGYDHAKKIFSLEVHLSRFDDLLQGI